MTLHDSLARCVQKDGLAAVLGDLVHSHGLLVVLEGLANVEGDIAEVCLKRAENGSAYDHSRAASVIIQAARYIAHGSRGVVTANDGATEAHVQAETTQPKKKARARAST